MTDREDSKHLRAIIMGNTTVAAGLTISLRVIGAATAMPKMVSCERIQHSLACVCVCAKS